jgi:transcriptional regulator with XRE-family HTH domain
MDKDISTLLREIKEATRWSEPRIAAELGTSQPTVNRILNGQADCKATTYRAITLLHQAQVAGPLLGRRAADLLVVASQAT